MLDTTRLPRLGESDGKEYHFITVESFKTMISENQFLEWAIYSGNYYGTSLASMTELQGQGKVPILDIDLEGVKSVHRLNDKVNARFVFIRTKDLATLEGRLKGRGTETDASLQLRLLTAAKEMEYAEKYPDTHDTVIVNEDLDGAFEKLESFLFNAL